VPAREESRFHAVLSILLACAAAANIGAAQGQSLLPDTGTSLQVGSLRQQIEGALATGTGGTPAAPGWTFIPSIAVEERWTSQAEIGSQASRSRSFITVLRPGLMMNTDSTRLKATLNYAPSVYLYGATPSQNRVGQTLGASGFVTLIPEEIFLDLRGYAALQSTSGGYGPNSTVTLSRQNETQAYSFSATPTLRHRFGDAATAEVGTTLSSTAQTNLGNSTSFPYNTGNQNATVTREYVSLTSGAGFGRTSARLHADALQSIGSGVMNGATSNMAAVDTGYAITRNLTALARLGYENIHYNGIPPYQFSGVVWNVGVRWTPNQDSAIILRYGLMQGVYTGYLDASYAPTARTRVFARYSEGLSTGVEDLRNAVNASVLDPLGRPADAETGAPLMLTNNFYRVQNDLSRVKRASLTGLMMLERDSISISVSSQNSTQIAAASVSSLGNRNADGVFGSINWQRDIAPRLRSTAFVQYGTNRNVAVTGTQTSSTLILSVGLTWLASETLSGWLQCSHTSRFVVGTATSPPASLATIGLRKTF
jgi:uncharacterized protein (PEP-CTERM system associated)